LTALAAQSGDTQIGASDARRLPEHDWAMLATLAERVFDLEHQRLR
jgi:hypothetical protein